MKPDIARQTRINDLHKQALFGKFTKNGKFNYAQLVAAAKLIGVTNQTAQSYAEAVVVRLKEVGKIN